MTTRNIEAIYPLTPTQEGMLFHTLYGSDAPLYVQQFTCRLDGPLDVDRFRQAWDRVIERHAVMRSLIAWEGREQPLQIVRRTVAPEWRVEDWRAEEELDERLDEFLVEDRHRGFSLDVAPLMRFALFATDADRHRFVWTHHHIALDGWSMGIVLDEVFLVYEALVGGVEPDLAEPPAYRDYVRWLRALPEGTGEDYWRRRLDGVQGTTGLRIESMPPASPWASDQEVATVRLDEDASRRLGELGRRHELTLNTLVQGAWALVLSRYDGSDDVVFGATHAGRPPELPGALDMVGLFIATLPVRVRLDRSISLGDWLAGLQAEQAETSDHQSTPLSEIQKWAGVTPGTPLFETLLVFENVPHPATGAGTIVTSDVRYLQRSNYPLAILVMPGTQLELHLLFDAERFDRRIIDRLGAQILHTLDSMESCWNDPVDQVPLFPPAEEAQIFAAWNDTAAPFPATTVDELILEAAAAAPSRPAVAGDQASVTYHELAERSEVLVRALSAHGVGPGSRVGICCERSPAMIVALLGVLRAGAAYVPLDPDLPPARLQLLADEVKPDVVMVGAGLDLTLSGQMIRLAADGSPTEDEPTVGAPERRHTADDLAYVLHTSGSTGTPKGVAVRHRNLVASTHARRLAYGDDPPVFLLLSPFIFDSSVAGIFSSLTGGGTLVLPGPRMEQDVLHLAELIERHRVTQTLCLPSVYGLLLELADPDSLRSLELVMVAGEACPPSLVQRHHEVLPGTTLVNEYGPTECTVWCTVAWLDPSTARGHRVPIGRPIANTVAYVLDDRGRPCPVGVPGELYVGGAGLAAGYLDRPDLTEERFVTVTPRPGEPVAVYRTGDLARWLPDGTLDLLGRLDQQVKIRGQRIEIEEVEAILRTHPSVDEAVVRVVDNHGTPTLVALVEADSVPEDLREFAAERLPHAMVPSDVQHLPRLPRGRTGKVDRTALPEPELRSPTTRVASRPPQGAAEEQLAAIWRDVLGVEHVGAADDFFELGGDSILSIRVIARARSAGLMITPRQFFDEPTVAALAAGTGR